jgi:ankyrin repeat protein
LHRSTSRAGTLAAAAFALWAAALSAASFGQEVSLADLVRSGQREAVLAAITSPDIDVNAPDPDGSTALLWATYNVDRELVHALLKKGAKANVTNHFGASPLAEAAKLGDIELLGALLDAGADPDSANQDGQTALMLASSVGAPKQVAELLIRHGANVNAVEAFRGQTALMWAAAGNHPDLVEVLVAHGASVNVRAKFDDWPRQMTSEPRAQFRQTGGLTALLYAARSGCYRCAVAIVNAGADVNQPNPDGITPLINAINNRSYDMAMFLLDKGANPGAWDMTGRTPLYVAVDMNSFKGGANNFGAPAEPNPASGATAMDVIDRLLKMGVDPNHELTRMRPNGAGRGRFSEYMLRGGTGPLMAATLGYDSDAIRALLAHGAEVDLPNVFRITPLMAAAGMTGSFRSAIDPVGGTTPPPGDIQLHAIEVIDLLLAGGANINARVTDNHNRTARLTAYVYNRENEGKTALFAAAEFGWDKVVRHLLDCGADPTLRDAAGKTALDYARADAPVSPGGTPADDANGARYKTADRQATVAILEAAMPKSGG